MEAYRKHMGTHKKTKEKMKTKTKRNILEQYRQLQTNDRKVQDTYGYV